MVETWRPKHDGRCVISFAMKIFTPAWWWVGWWRCGRTSVAAQSCAGSLLRHTMLAHPLSLTFQVGQVVAVVLVVVPVMLGSSLEVKPFSCFWHFGLPASNQVQALSRKSWSSNKESRVDNVNIWNIVSVILWWIFFGYNALPLALRTSAVETFFSSAKKTTMLT